MRYAPGRDFPPYAYLPGRDPHPTRDPEGHSYGTEETPPPYMPPEQWERNEEYLFGVDLYNAGYLWEAHEAWEDPWRAAPPQSADAAFLRGLIQCAAACLKVRRGRTDGARRIAARAGSIPGWTRATETIPCGIATTSWSSVCGPCRREPPTS